MMLFSPADPCTLGTARASRLFAALHGDRVSPRARPIVLKVLRRLRGA
jgi:hypothetical protein